MQYAYNTVTDLKICFMHW